jgi:hypothetical protein
MAGRTNNNQFYRTHGFHILDIADAESVTPEAIRMRFHNFGTMYQRRRKPTRFERMYGRTLFEIAEERNLHPITIESHQKTHNNAYHTNPLRTWNTRPSYGTGSIPVWREAVQSGKYWRKQNPWLHPHHPDYNDWREGRLYPDEYIGGSSMTAEEVERMMHNFNWSKYEEPIK